MTALNTYSLSCTFTDTSLLILLVASFTTLAIQHGFISEHVIRTFIASTGFPSVYLGLPVLLGVIIWMAILSFNNISQSLTFVPLLPLLQLNSFWSALVFSILCGSWMIYFTALMARAAGACKPGQGALRSRASVYAWVSRIILRPLHILGGPDVTTVTGATESDKFATRLRYGKLHRRYGVLAGARKLLERDVLLESARITIAQKDTELARKGQVIQDLEAALTAGVHAEDELLQARDIVGDLKAKISYLESQLHGRDVILGRLEADCIASSEAHTQIPSKAPYKVISLEAQVSALEQQLAEARAEIDRKDQNFNEYTAAMRQEADHWEARIQVLEMVIKARDDADEESEQSLSAFKNEILDLGNQWEEKFDTLQRKIKLREAEIDGLKWELAQKSDKALRAAKWARRDKDLPKILVTSPPNEFIRDEHFPKRMDMTILFGHDSFKQVNTLKDAVARRRHRALTCRPPLPPSTSPPTTTKLNRVLQRLNRA